MLVKAQTVIMSHLSDVQDLNGMPSKTARLHMHVNFAKFLIQRYPNVMDKIDPDKEYEDFLKKGFKEE